MKIINLTINKYGTNSILGSIIAYLYSEETRSLADLSWLDPKKFQFHVHIKDYYTYNTGTGKCITDDVFVDFLEISKKYKGIHLTVTIEGLSNVMWVTKSLLKKP